MSTGLSHPPFNGSGRFSIERNPARWLKLAQLIHSSFQKQNKRGFQPRASAYSALPSSDGALESSPASLPDSPSA
jgi:hypothetical protein